MINMIIVNLIIFWDKFYHYRITLRLQYRVLESYEVFV